MSCLTWEVVDALWQKMTCDRLFCGMEREAFDGAVSLGSSDRIGSSIYGPCHSRNCLRPR